MECPQRSKKTFLLKFRFWTKLLVRQNFSRTKLLVGHKKPVKEIPVLRCLGKSSLTNTIIGVLF